jgi:hypothetical protein
MPILSGFVCEEGEPKAQSWRFFEKQITKVPTFCLIVMFMVTHFNTDVPKQHALELKSRFFKIEK